MNLNDDTFLLLSGESDGCYMCDGRYNIRADIYRSIEEVVNIFHDMMEKKIPNDYPAQLFLIDGYGGEILGDLQLGFDARCLGGLKEIFFKHNNMIYKVKKGARK